VAEIPVAMVRASAVRRALASVMWSTISARVVGRAEDVTYGALGVGAVKCPHAAAVDGVNIVQELLAIGLNR
jgi:hypothetical protein